MDAQPNVSFGARRNEDIALDLLKFISVTAGVGKPAAPSTGFSGAAGPKPEEHVNQLLELYSRCLKAVEGHQAGSRPLKSRSRKSARRKAGRLNSEPEPFARCRCRSRSLRQEPPARLPRAGNRGCAAYGPSVALAAAVEPDEARAAETAAKYSIPVFPSIDKLLAAGLHLDAATIAVPTVHHHAVASQLLDAGLDLLVEKPLAASLAEADDLIRRAARGKRILQPGHLERFNPAVLAIQPQLRRPMFFEAHRLSVFTPRSLDVDVVLDLMIHDLDIVLTFASSPVREVRAVGLPILSPKVDIS